MGNIRRKSLPFEFQGKTYILRCNMAVLADVQEENGGLLSPSLSRSRVYKNTLMYLAAMMNDYSDEMSWPERFTWRGLGRVLRPKMIPSSQIIGLVLGELETSTKAAGNVQEEEAGN